MTPRKPSAAAIAKARALYDDSLTPLQDIAATLKLSRHAFLTMRRKLAWPKRPAPAKAAKPAPKPRLPEDGGCDEPIDTGALKKRLAHALRREIARVESELETVAPPGAERKARILASLVKTLADLRRLDDTMKQASQGGAQDDGRDDGPPRDLATLRQALVERLEDLRGQRDAG
jgi:hypothetical protein